MEQLPHVQLLAGDAEDAIRILQLTDMHLFPEQAEAWHCTAKGTCKPRLVDFAAEHFPTPFSNESAAALVDSLVRSARPHLVVFTGDIVDGRPFGETNPAVIDGKLAGTSPSPAAFELFAKSFVAVLAPLIELNVPWCFCPGNHDDGSPWSRDDLLRVFSLPGCATPTATRFDHTLTIGFGSAADANSVRLWIFDSGPNRPTIKYAPVAPAAIAEYDALSAVLPPCAAELAYVHVPLPEYATSRLVAGKCALFAARLRAGMVEAHWRWLASIFGVRGALLVARLTGHDRAVGCSKVNTGLASALRRARTVRAVSCGHNHFNDYVAAFGGLYLCFGRVSGITPPTTWENDGGPLPFAPGGRVMAVRSHQPDARPQVETWIETRGGKEDFAPLPAGYPANTVGIALNFRESEKPTGLMVGVALAAVAVLTAGALQLAAAR